MQAKSRNFMRRRFQTGLLAEFALVFMRNVWREWKQQLKNSAPSRSESSKRFHACGESQKKRAKQAATIRYLPVLELCSGSRSVKYVPCRTLPMYVHVHSMRCKNKYICPYFKGSEYRHPANFRVVLISFWLLFVVKKLDFFIWHSTVPSLTSSFYKSL